MAITQIPLVLTLKNKFLRQLWPHNWILGRHACLGFEVMRALNCSIRDINSQKGRVDLLLSANHKLSNNIDIAGVKSYLSRRDLLDLIAQQKYLHLLPKKAPKFILLDSYSELTDKLFEHKNQGWKFCCHNSDVNINSSFSKSFNCRGLLDIDSIDACYSRLIDFLSIKYPNVPIIFLNYPKALEKRSLYLERSEAIENSIKAISLRNKFLYPIKINEEIVTWKCDAEGIPDMYPYHYNPETYSEFAKVISALTPVKEFR